MDKTVSGKVDLLYKNIDQYNLNYMSSVKRVKWQNDIWNSKPPYVLFNRVLVYWEKQTSAIRIYDPNEGDCKVGKSEVQTYPLQTERNYYSHNRYMVCRVYDPELCGIISTET
jgi:hypothetical protein